MTNFLTGKEFRIAFTDAQRVGQTGQIDSVRIDMANHDSLIAMIELGDAPPNSVLSLAWSDAANTTDSLSVVTGTETRFNNAADLDNKLFVMALEKPFSRYNAITVARANGNIAIRSAILILDDFIDIRKVSRHSDVAVISNILDPVN